MIDLDELEGLANRATPGPWHAHEFAASSWYNETISHPDFIPEGKASQRCADAAFIAAAREAVPELIHEVRRLRDDLACLDQHHRAMQRRAT